MLNLKYFIAFTAISIVSCYVDIPEEYWNAKPLSEHPRIKKQMQLLSPKVLEPSKDPFVIGGLPAVRGQFPHQVLIFRVYANNTAYLCGGSIIHRQWVLTTAHCVHRNAAYFDVYTGIVNTTGPASWGTRLQNSNIHIHPQYTDTSPRHNIAMMNLVDAPDDLLNYPYTGMIQLPTEAVNLVDLVGSISGFGRIKDNTTTASRIMLYNSLRVMSNSRCAMYYVPGTIFDEIICAETNGTVSTCGSDLGGPYSFVINGVNRLEGVASFYAEPGCELGYPVGFTRVSSYLGWIDDTITGRNSTDPWDILRDIQEQYLVTLQNIIEGTSTLVHDEI